MTPNNFICPECGSREVDQMQFVEPEPAPANIWSGVLERYRCANCHSVIPAHLAERWDNLSPDQAQQQWRESYRDSQPKWD